LYRVILAARADRASGLRIDDEFEGSLLIQLSLRRVKKAKKAKARARPASGLPPESHPRHHSQRRGSYEIVGGF
jgi:hypothetical protein